MSIDTGLHAESHGVVNNMVYDPDPKFQKVLDFPFADFWNFDNVWILDAPMDPQRAFRGRTSHWSCNVARFSFPLQPSNDTLPTKVFSWNESYPFTSRVGLVIDWITDERSTCTHSARNPLNEPHGTHGYDNRKLPMHPFFMAHGPAFRAGYQGDVFDKVDLYPHICKIIGLKAPSNNGSLAKVIHLLRRKGFAMGSPVGWVMGASLVIGLTLILGTMSALISGKTVRRREGIPEMSSIREFGDIGGGGGGGGDKSSKKFPVNSEECQALLL